MLFMVKNYLLLDCMLIMKKAKIRILESVWILLNKHLMESRVMIGTNILCSLNLFNHGLLSHSFQWHFCLQHTLFTTFPLHVRRVKKLIWAFHITTLIITFGYGPNFNSKIVKHIYYDTIFFNLCLLISNIIFLKTGYNFELDFVSTFTILNLNMLILNYFSKGFLGTYLLNFLN